MGLALWLALQASAPSAPPTAIPSDFDLATFRLADGPGRSCAARDSSEIVVCGRRPSGGDYPFEAMARLFEPKPVVAETSLGGVTARAYVESATMPDGTVSKRLMVGIKLPF